ncbi:CGNR zinc finger domain-containing protein [Streptomyces sp. NBC_01408]|uniref:CGNR zinc finger domain-containing protein n=1 Tax=Streptomyces sp. NBC_01408 TaxID=2903855 RepID=UPI00225235BE|nr:CGNR zinc finger domain-containing protein [Streptomyces sp. NBC_01408]MCX4692531.1 CGNR zinc finger domain-containing protein [Streptomyces sp. NBC_01408]
MITHDVQRALDVLVGLLNTAPDVCGREDLSDLAALRGFLARHGIGGPKAPAASDLAAVLRVRCGFRDVLRANSTQAAVVLVNTLISGAGTTPRLTHHDGQGWHLHHFAPQGAPADDLAVDAGMALASVIVAGEWERLRRCAAPGCTRHFLDLSRNRSRRYCDSRTCGNRLHVAAYRTRRRTGPEGMSSAALIETETVVPISGLHAPQSF